MQIIECDEAKDASNVAKHGISLRRAEDLDIFAVVEAKPGADGEPRLRAYGYIDDQIYCSVFTMRDEVTRVISLRRAHSREVRRHAP